MSPQRHTGTVLCLLVASVGPDTQYNNAEIISYGVLNPPGCP